MKLNTVNTIAGILSGIKINKISDKAIKTTLVNDYMHLRKFVKEAEEQRKEFVDKFQADWRDELESVEAFRRENKPVVGHDEYLEAERDANSELAEMFMKEVEINLKPVKMDSFIAACGNEELTLEQIAFFEENGLIEQ